MSENLHPRIKRHYSIVGHSADCVELRWGVWNPVSFTITDESEARRLYRLIKRLDGSASLRTVALEEDVPRADLEALVDQLTELDVIERAPCNALDFYLDTMLPTRAAGNPGAERIVLLGDAPLTSRLAEILRASLPAATIDVTPHEDPLATALRTSAVEWMRSGIELEEGLESFEPWRGALLVLATATAHPLQLRMLNRIALAHSIPWLPALLDGPFVIVGPTVVPRRSACFECFELRVLLNARESASYQRYKDALVTADVRSAQQPLLSALHALVCAQAGLEAINYAITGSTFTVNKALTIHLPTMEFAYHDVLRAPTCGACGSLPERDDTELYLSLGAVFDPGASATNGSVAEALT